MIVVVEGINGAGKTTFSRHLVDVLTNRLSVDACLIDPIEATPFGVDVRGCVMNEKHLDPEAEALAFASARLHGARAIVDLHGGAQGSVIVLERWTGALFAYGEADGVEPSLLQTLADMLQAALPVEQQLLIDTSGAIADDRLKTETETNKFETRGASYLERVGERYRSWARSEGHAIINCSGDRLHAQVERTAEEIARLFEMSASESEIQT